MEFLSIPALKLDRKKVEGYSNPQKMLLNLLHLIQSFANATVPRAFTTHP